MKESDSLLVQEDYETISNKVSTEEISHATILVSSSSPCCSPTLSSPSSFSSSFSSSTSSPKSPSVVWLLPSGYSSLKSVNHLKLGYFDIMGTAASAVWSFFWEVDCHSLPTQLLDTSSFVFTQTADVDILEEGAEPQEL